MKNTGIKKVASRLSATDRSSGFSLSELLIVVAVLAILSGAAYLGIRQTMSFMTDHKITTDLRAIENALNAYEQDNGSYPLPVLDKDKNILCFRADTSYAHCKNSFSGSAFIRTQIDNSLLTKKYLQEVPADPRTGARYAYGVSSDGQFFQVAAVIRGKDGEDWAAVTEGNLADVSDIVGLESLIRSFDSSDFVMDGENHLPYSPNHMNISARLDITGDGVTVNGKQADDDTISKPGDTIETDSDSTAVIYFSDGSVTYLNEDTTLLVLPASDVEQNDEDGIITKIRLKLFQGKIWNKVIRLSSESEFNVETTSAIAGVRGTEFGMEATGDKMIVHSGVVLARLKTSDELASSEPVIFSTADLDHPEFTADFDKDADTDEDFLKFTLVKKTGTMAKGDIIIDTIELKTDYYSDNFSNNVIPRILNIDTRNSPNEVIVFRYISGIHKIHAFDTDEKLIHTWEKKDINFYPDKGTMTVNPSVLYGLDPVRFRFEDDRGNRTFAPNPSIDFIAGIPSLKESMIYNTLFTLKDSGGEGGQQPECGNGDLETGEQCDDGNTNEFDACDNSCNTTGIVFYADYADGQNDTAPDYSSVPVEIDSMYAGIDTGGLIIEVTDGAFLSYTNGQFPDLRRGQIEIMVNGADLKAQPGETVNLFDTQLSDNPDTNDYRVDLVRKATDRLEFTLREKGANFIFARIEAADVADLPDGQLRIVAEWSTLAINKADRVRLTVFEGNVVKAYAENPMNNYPDLGLTFFDTFFVGSPVKGQVANQFSGYIKSFLIRDSF